MNERAQVLVPMVVRPTRERAYDIYCVCLKTARFLGTAPQTRSAAWWYAVALPAS